MVSIFGSVGKCFGRELKEAKESNVLLALEFPFFLSLCCLDKMVAKGGEAIWPRGIVIGRERLCYYFSFSFGSLLQKFSLQ